MRCDGDMRITRRALLESSLLLPAASAAPQREGFLYIGGYTNGASKGIQACTFDAETGKAGPLQEAVAVSNPSFLAIHPDGRYLYAANEIGNFGGQRAGAISSFARDAHSGRLTMLNQVSSKGPGPCFVSVDRTGHVVLAANYSGGSVVSFTVGGGGTLSEAVSFYQHSGNGPNAKRQEGPHAHSINPDKAARFAVAADLGTDQVLVYRLDTKDGKLSPNDPPYTKVAPGSGPRHFAFHPSQKFGYVINELLSTVTAFRYDDGKGTLTEIETVPALPAGWQGSSTTAQVLVHPSGKFLYGSNRGHDSIVVFRIDEKTGKLTLVQHEPTQGKVPRNFNIHPNGRWLLAANQNSNNVVFFRLDEKTGKLTPTGDKLESASPTCVLFAPALHN
jgi:6-phosphogluconolactonase